MTPPLTGAPARAILLLLPAVLAMYGQDRLGEPMPRVRVTGLASPAGAKVILINAKGDAPSCHGSVLLALDQPQNYYAPTGTLEIASHVSPGCWCDDENAGLAVLAPDRAVAYFRNTRKRPAMPRLLCTKRAEFVIEMRPRVEVPIHVWESDWRMHSMAKDEVANADWIFSKELTGITLRPTFHHREGATFQFCQPGGNEDCDPCAKATESATFQPGAVNVYYGVKDNKTCRDDHVVFIHMVPVLGDLAHELGHRFGLFQNDNESPEKFYDTGHTNAIDPFNWQNVMWQKTQLPKHRLSPGQAFWMTQSCVSFVGESRACLTCSDEPGLPSPCPPFSLGQGDEPGECQECDFKAESSSIAPRLIELRRETGDRTMGDTPESIFCTRRELEAEMGKRYHELKKHTRHRYGLELGADSRDGFVRQWTPEYALDNPPKSQR